MSLMVVAIGAGAPSPASQRLPVTVKGICIGRIAAAGIQHTTCRHMHFLSVLAYYACCACAHARREDALSGSVVLCNVTTPTARLPIHTQCERVVASCCPVVCALPPGLCADGTGNPPVDVRRNATAATV